VVTEWIGNSVAIAAKHYLQTTEADFQAALQRAANSGAVRSAFNSQQMTDQNEQGSKTPGIQALSTPVHSSQFVNIPPAGLEPAVMPPRQGGAVAAGPQGHQRLQIQDL